MTELVSSAAAGGLGWVDLAGPCGPPQWRRARRCVAELVQHGCELVLVSINCDLAMPGDLSELLAAIDADRERFVALVARADRHAWRIAESCGRRYLLPSAELGQDRLPSHAALDRSMVDGLVPSLDELVDRLTDELNHKEAAR